MQKQEEEKEEEEGGREAIRQPGPTTFRLAEVNRVCEGAHGGGG